MRFELRRKVDLGLVQALSHFIGQGSWSWLRHGDLGVDGCDNRSPIALKGRCTFTEVVSHYLRGVLFWGGTVIVLLHNSGRSERGD